MKNNIIEELEKLEKRFIELEKRNPTFNCNLIREKWNKEDLNEWEELNKTLLRRFGIRRYAPASLVNLAKFFFSLQYLKNEGELKP